MRHKKYKKDIFKALPLLSNLRIKQAISSTRALSAGGKQFCCTKAQPPVHRIVSWSSKLQAEQQIKAFFFFCQNLFFVTFKSEHARIENTRYHLNAAAVTLDWEKVTRGQTQNVLLSEMVETKRIFFFFFGYFTYYFFFFFYIKTYKSLIIIGNSNIYKTLQHNAI